MNMVRAHVVVAGLVQGVFFRSYAVEEARALGVTGWVANRWDGRVEALVEGDKTAVDRMVEWLRTGPSTARVEKIDIKWENYTGEFDTFSVEY